jgi:hypothetical protein
MLLALLHSVTALAGPKVGLELLPGTDPLQTQEMSPQVDQVHQLLRPPLNVWVGLEKERWTWQLSLGAARQLTTRWDAGQARRYAVTAFRPGVEAQRRWDQEQVLSPNPFLAAGLWGVVPIVRDRSSAYGPAEQDAANESARGVMAQLGGVGIRLGGGLDLPLNETLSVGAAGYWSLWRGQSIDEDAWSTAALGWSEVVIRASVRL